MFIELIKCCEDIELNSPGVVIKEPYIPYFRESSWNRVLVLAEAQNLSDEKYVKAIVDGKDKTSIIKRLYRNDGSYNPGIGPWDDGMLKLAVEAALNIKPEETAISNGVLWSMVDIVRGKRINKNPTDETKKPSIKLWSEMLMILRPEKIITAGAIAREIIKEALKRNGLNSTHHIWALPSKRVFDPIKYMVNEEDMIERFPKVGDIVKREFNNGQRKIGENHIIYTCLAVSISQKSI
jgi:hypothetical protein